MMQSNKDRRRTKTHLQVEILSRQDLIDPLQVIACRLRALRLARGLTHWAMGERGVSPKYYQRIESGRVNVTIRTLDRVSRALGATLEEFFRFAWRPAQRRRRTRRV